MKKVQIMSFCPTRMMYRLSTCSHVVSLLVSKFGFTTKFLENLELDDHGNLSAMSVVDDNSIYEVSLIFLHQPSRTGNPDKLQQIKKKHFN